MHHPMRLRQTMMHCDYHDAVHVYPGVDWRTQLCTIGPETSVQTTHYAVDCHGCLIRFHFPLEMSQSHPIPTLVPPGRRARRSQTDGVTAVHDRSRCVAPPPEYVDVSAEQQCFAHGAPSVGVHHAVAMRGQ